MTHLASHLYGMVLTVSLRTPKCQSQKAVCIGEVKGPVPQQRSNWPDDHVVLYDGTCGLCSRWIRFVARRDTAARWRFAPIQSPYGRRLAVSLAIDPIDPDTNAAVAGGMAYTKSDAALAVISSLRGWRWIRILRWLPRPTRDFVYRQVARNRYRIFGQNSACDLGGADLASRILTK